MSSLALTVLLAGSAAAFDLPWAPGTPAELVYQVEPTGQPKLDKTLAERSAEALRHRLEVLQMNGKVEIRGSGRIAVTFSLKGDDPEALLRPLVKPSNLEFRIASPEKKKPGPGETTAPDFSLDPQTKEVRRGELVVSKSASLGGADIAAARLYWVTSRETPEPAVTLEFTPEGNRKLKALTQENIGRTFATLWNGRVLS